jgi:hypothetical protein
MKAKFTITSISIGIVLMFISGPILQFLDVSNTDTQKTARISTASYIGSTKTHYAVNETFSDPLIAGSIAPDWYAPIPWGYQASANTTTGELQLKTYLNYPMLVRQNFSLTKSDFSVSFNFRTCADTLVDGGPWIFNMSSRSWTTYENWSGPWGIGLQFEENYTLGIKADSGSKKPSPIYAMYYSTNRFANDTNYQFNITFTRWNDSAKLTVTNKSSSSVFFEGTFSTAYSCLDSPRQNPDRFGIGDTDLWGPSNRTMHWFYDNLTLSSTRADNAGISLDNSAICTAISRFADQMLRSNTEAYPAGPNNYKLGQHLLTNTTYGILRPNNFSGSRDDVAGDMIGSLAWLYSQDHDNRYLILAESIWTTLKTHQQSDGGFTFSDNTQDFSDTVCRIALGLMALYQASGKRYYLMETAPLIANLITYQTIGGDADGQVYGYHKRGDDYALNNLPYFTGYFAVTLLKYYELTENAPDLVRALKAVDFISRMTTSGGRVIGINYSAPYTPPYTGGLPFLNYGDYNDVSNAGIALWATSEAYALTNDPEYLSQSQLLANYLVTSEFTKNGSSWGVWSGIGKDRFNQSDLVYNYVIGFGLRSYIKIMPSDTDAKQALYSSLNFYASVLGSNVSVQGHTLTGAKYVWGGSWNLNNTSSPGWTVGYWDEGRSWAANWGEVGFYGWQGNIVKVMIGDIVPFYSPEIFHIGAVLKIMMILCIVVPVVVRVVDMTKGKRKLKVEDLFRMVVFIVIGLTLIGVVFTMLP